MSVILPSTTHRSNSVDSDSRKPDIILFYNKTKGPVDTFDQLSHSYSIQRKAKRWSLACFYNLLNLANINAFCYVHELISKLKLFKIESKEAVFVRTRYEPCERYNCDPSMLFSGHTTTTHTGGHQVLRNQDTISQ